MVRYENIWLDMVIYGYVWLYMVIPHKAEFTKLCKS